MIVFQTNISIAEVLNWRFSADESLKEALTDIAWTKWEESEAHNPEAIFEPDHVEVSIDMPHFVIKFIRKEKTREVSNSDVDRDANSIATPVN